MGWQRDFRNQFLVVDECVYFDNAYDCGGTKFGISATKKYFSDWKYGAVNNERGGPGRKTLFKVIDETRILLNRLIGGIGCDQIAFTKNTNDGINAILQGFDFKVGDNIVLSGQEHPSVLIPCLNAEKTRGIEVKVVPTREDNTISIDEFIDNSDKKTRIIFVSHVQSSTGYRIDLEKLGKWCYEHDVFLVVDAIQSLGIQPFYAEKWHVSAVTSASYKGLCGINSIGFTYYHPKLLKHIWPSYVAHNSYIGVNKNESQYSLYCTDDSQAKKMENSSFDNLGIYILNESLKRLLHIGMDNMWQHVNSLYVSLYAGLEELNFNIVTPFNEVGHCGILSINCHRKDIMFQYFRENNICLSISDNQYIRFSLGGFNNEKDVQYLLSVAKRFKMSEIG